MGLLCWAVNIRVPTSDQLFLLMSLLRWKNVVLLQVSLIDISADFRWFQFGSNFEADEKDTRDGTRCFAECAMPYT